MVTRGAVVHEVKAVGVAMLFFGCWIGTLLLIRHLVLAEHQIEMYDYGAAIMGALVLSKVVIVLERVPLGGWVRARPAYVGVALRTAMYTAGVVVVLGVEHGIRGRTAHGGFLPAVEAAVRSTDENHLWVSAICIGGALLTWNVFAVVRAHLGEGAIVRMLQRPLPVRAGEHARTVAP